MPQEDAIHWNARYSTSLGNQGDAAPKSFLTENVRYLPPEGLALDIATGLGGNAHFLLSHGLHVIGVDISEVAIRANKARFPHFMGIVADLTQFYLPDRTFDVILNFYYLQRNLWPDYVRALRPGGILFFETMTDKMLTVNPGMNPAYLLAVGELANAFPSLDTLVYEEVSLTDESKITQATARLIARKAKT